MVSRLHESLLLLFRNQPALAAELIREVLGAEIPAFEEARVVSADLTDIQPAEYRADMVVELFDDGPVFAIILEVQLSPHPRKRFVWLGPSAIPEVTDEAQARSNPDLAVLSAMAHGHDADVHKSVQIAIAAQSACQNLDDDRARLYCDLTISFLAEAARNALENMAQQKYEYQSDFARRYVAQGVEQGMVEGRRRLIARLLTVRFGAVSPDVETKLLNASADEVDAIGERLLNARTLQEALG